MKETENRGQRSGNSPWRLAISGWLLAIVAWLSATKKRVATLLATIFFWRKFHTQDDTEATLSPTANSQQPIADDQRQFAIGGWRLVVGMWLSATKGRAWSHLAKGFFRRTPEDNNEDTANSQRLIAVRLPSALYPLAASSPKSNRQLPITAGTACLLLALLLGGAGALGSATPAQCSGLCQGCYCDQIINGTCIVNGGPSSCIGCVGSCITPGECQCGAGIGGCGAVVAWCRGSDCQPREDPTPTPVPTPTPLPPACQEGIYDFIQPPRVVDWYHRPDYPTVVGQDTTFRGFDLIVSAAGGFAETRQVALEQLCPDGGNDPAQCPADWRWQCTERTLVHFDDPIVAVDLPMRLADSSVAWLTGELPQRYYNASPKEGLPKTFPLWRGEAMSVQTGLFDYKAQDPGVHGGQILVTTKGTPLNPPQRIAQPYSVKVHLLDTTLDK